MSIVPPRKGCGNCLFPGDPARCPLHRSDWPARVDSAQAELAERGSCWAWVGTAEFRAEARPYDIYEGELELFRKMSWTAYEADKQALASGDPDRAAALRAVAEELRRG